MASLTGDGTMWDGDAGSLGGAGVTGRGEGTSSQGDVGIEGDEADVEVSLVGEKALGDLAAGGVADGGVADGEVAAGGVADSGAT
jgi:hypothetical protein